MPRRAAPLAEVAAALRAVAAFSFERVWKRRGYRAALARWCAVKRRARLALTRLRPTAGD